MPKQRATGVSNYDAANTPVKARNLRLVQRLHCDFVESCNGNLVFTGIMHLLFNYDQISKIRPLCRVQYVDPVSLWRALC